MKRLFLVLFAMASSASCMAQTMSGLCMLTESHRTNKPAGVQVMLTESSCDKDSHTGNCMEMSDSSLDWQRWTGVSPDALQREGASLSARMTGEAGEVVCDGVVHDAVLAGRFRFTANENFLQQMASLGFDGILPRKQLGLLMLDVTPAWTRQMQALGITEMTTNKLNGLRALHVDADYIHSLANAGYPELRANKLVEMKAIGVTPEKIAEIKALGFQPTESELIQACVFKIDRAFIERMRARGLTDLTISKLVKIKTFKLDN
jgi:hypothetical protein